MNTDNDYSFNKENIINFHNKTTTPPSQKKLPVQISPEDMVNKVKNKGNLQNTVHINKTFSSPPLSSSNVNLLVEKAKHHTQIDAESTYPVKKKLPISTEDVKKVDLVGRKNIPTYPQATFITSGAAKNVFKSNVDPKKVIYTPVPDFFKTKLKEIQEEVKAAGSIQANLYTHTLLKIFDSDAFKSNAYFSDYKIERLALIKILKDNYSTPMDLANAIKNESLFNVLTKTTLPQKAVANLLTKLSHPDLIQLLEEAGKNLALDLKEINSKDGYAVETIAAHGDAEKLIRAKNDFSELFQLGGQFIHGMKDLHSVNRVQGDLKPENILVYGKLNDKDEVVDKQGNKVKLDEKGRLNLSEIAIENSKVSDWGKEKPINDDEDVLYTGNPRFAPPEMRLSKQGEVYSSALILIRILEESVLDKNEMSNEKSLDNRSNVGALTDMLIPIDDTNKDELKQVQANRRGIEKFLSLNKFTSQSEVKTLTAGFKVYGKSIVSSNNSLDMKQLQKSQQQTDLYIEELISRLTPKRHLTSEGLKQLEDLLKDMTKANPSERPTMDQVHQRYSQIKGKLA